MHFKKLTKCIKYFSTEVTNLLRGHPKMSTFSQVYKPYTRGEGVTPDI